MSEGKEEIGFLPDVIKDKIRDEAEKGAEKAIPKIREEVRKEVGPLVKGVYWVSGLALTFSIIALLRGRK